MSRPIPDDESIGAVATLLALRHAKHEVINLACSLGRLTEPKRRRVELETACGRAEFELIVHSPPLHISSGDDLAAARALAATVGSAHPRATSRRRRLTQPARRPPRARGGGTGRAGRRLRGASAGPAPLSMWGLWATCRIPLSTWDSTTNAWRVRSTFWKRTRASSSATTTGGWCAVGRRPTGYWGPNAYSAGEPRAARSRTPSSSRRWSGATASGGQVAHASSTRRSRSPTARARRCASAGGSGSAELRRSPQASEIRLTGRTVSVRSGRPGGCGRATWAGTTPWSR